MNTPKRRLQNRKQLQKNPALAEHSQTSIEDLPEGILIDILSFLPTTAAVKTTVIATPWRNLWHSVPLLDFDMVSFHSNIPDKSTREARKRFAEFITQTLIHRPTHFPLRKFKLRFCYGGLLESSVHSWLEKVIGCRVAEVDLCFKCRCYHHNPGNPLEEEDDDTEHDGYGFFSPLFLGLSNSSVEVLKLQYVDLRIPGEAFSLKLDGIREVHLKDFCSSDKDIGHLMASCVNLESLSLVRGLGFKNLKIVSQQLKYLKLFKCIVFNLRDTSVDICAPNLESINLYCVYADKFSVKQTQSLVEARVNFRRRNLKDLYFWTNVVGSLSGIECLTVQYMWPWYLHQPSAFSDTFVFHNLKHLELWTGFSENELGILHVMFERSPQLASLVLVSNYQVLINALDENYKIKGIIRDLTKFFLPCLKLVEMRNFGATKNEMFIVDLLMHHGGKLEKIIAYPRKVNGISQPRVVLFENLDLP